MFEHAWFDLAEVVVLGAVDVSPIEQFEGQHGIAVHRAELLAFLFVHVLSPGRCRGSARRDIAQLCSLLRRGSKRFGCLAMLPDLDDLPFEFDLGVFAAALPDLD